MDILGSKGNDLELRITVDADGAIRVLNNFDKSAESAAKSVTESFSDIEKDVARSFERLSNTGNFKKLGDDIRKVLGKETADNADLISREIKQLGSTFVKSGGDVSDFERVIERLKVEIDQTNDKVRDSTRGFSGFQAAIVTANQAVNLLRTGFRAARRGVELLVEGISKGQEVENLTRSFESLQATVGGDATQALSGFQQATQGLVNDLDLMRAANQAVLLDLPTEGFNEAAGAAIKLGNAMGIDALASIQSFTTGVGRGSKLILDNLGILVNAEEANQRFADKLGIATKALTDQQRTLAFQEEAYRKIIAKGEELAISQNTAGIALQRLTVELQNQRNSFLQSIANSTDLGSSLDDLTRTIDDVDTTQLASDIGFLGGAFIGLAADIIEVAIPAIRDFVTGIKVIPEIIDAIGRGQGLSEAFDTAVVNVSLAETGDRLKKANDAYQKFKRTDAEFSKSPSVAKFAELTNASDKLKSTTTGLVGEFPKLSDRIELADKSIDGASEQAKKLKKELVGVIGGEGSGGSGLRGAGSAAKEATKKLSDYEKALNDLTDSAKDFAPLKAAFKTTALAADALITSQRAGLITNQQFADTLRRLTVDAGLSTDEIADLKQIIDQLQSKEITVDVLLKRKGSVSEPVEEPTFADGLIPGSIFGARGSRSQKEFEEQIQRDLATSITNGVSAAIAQVFDGDLRGSIAGAGGTAGRAVGTALGGPLGGAVGEEFGAAYGDSISGVGKSTEKTLAGITAVLTGGLSSLFNEDVERFFGGIFGNSDPGANARAGFASYMNKLVKDTDLKLDTFDLIGGRDAFDQFTNEFGEVTTAVGEKLKSLEIDPNLLSQFNDIGEALGKSLNLDELLGTGQIGQLLAVNFQDAAGLEDLQVLLERANVGADELKKNLEDAYATGKLEAGDFLNQNSAITDLFSAGIPSAVGDTNTALKQITENAAKGGAFLQNAFANLGVEGLEQGAKSAQDLVRPLIEAGNEVSQVEALITSLVNNGFNDLSKLPEISLLDTARLEADLKNGQFVFSKYQDDIDSIATKIDAIPTQVKTSYEIDVKANYDSSATRDLVQNGNIELPEPTGASL